MGFMEWFYYSDSRRGSKSLQLEYQNSQPHFALFQGGDGMGAGLGMSREFRGKQMMHFLFTACTLFTFDLGQRALPPRETEGKQFVNNGTP